MNNQKMYASFYNVYFNVHEKHYIFNTWHGNLISIEESDFNLIQNSKIDQLSNDLRTKLIQLGFLTSSKDEFSLVLKENNEKQNQYEKNHFSICISPTLRCNASCHYCFESGIEGCKDLDLATEDAIVDYVFKKSKGKKVHITWFGGEPLLGAKRISSICVKLNKLGVAFKSSIITNGFYIDQYIDEMKNLWQLKQVQITLDGIGEKYNAVKKMGKNGFEKVITNIHLLLKYKIHTALRVNYDAEHLNDYKEIIEFVYKEFGSTVKLYFHDIIGESFHTPDEAEGKPLLNIYSYLAMYGYVSSLRDLRIQRKHAACSINKKDFVNVFPGGWTNKCEHFVGKKSIFDSGNLQESNFHPELVFDSVRKNCFTCQCFPICGGGCYANHMMRENSGCFRGHSYLSEILEFYVENIFVKQK